MRYRPSRLFLLLVFVPAVVGAQAWTPPKGEGYASLTFIDTFTKDHFLSSGARLDIGHIRSVGLVPEIDFAFTNRLAVDLILPVIAAKYYGPDPHQLPIDNGNYHGGAQDFKVALRYNLRRRPLMLTPFASLGVPTREYTYYAHSAVGTRQREFALGIAVGRQFENWLPNAYFEGTFSYGIVESVDGVRPDRSHLGLESGYILGRRVTLRALAESQITHGGLNIPEDFPVMPDYPLPPDQRWSHHDQTANVNFLNFGSGVNVMLTRDWNAYATVYKTLWGENGHAIRVGLVAGMSWRFRTPWTRVTDETAPSSLTNHTDAPRH
jgi:hypothetical protein